jgi:ectoine hydroxylase
MTTATTAGATTAGSNGQASRAEAAPERPTAAERFFFETNGYLVLERFLDTGHVARLTEALQEAVARRRMLEQEGTPHTGQTDRINEESTRIFYILGDHPLFLEMLDWPPLMPYVHALLNECPHHHASDAIVERGLEDRQMGWHIDGHDNGFRNLGWPIPLLQLKVGYYLSDMTEPGQGNLCLVPGSHRSRLSPDATDLQRPDLFPGAVQVCAPPGSALLFHNALWHSGGPWMRPGGERVMLYYAYEHPWMIASQEHWGYPPAFYAGLSAAQRRFFHGFVFDPPEQRWG